MAKTLEYYLSLPYKIVLHPSPEGGYAVEIPELPGCISQGDTVEEAMAMIEDAKRAWIADALEHGEPVPEPIPEEYSGRILLRTPKSLHRRLMERARAEGVSLNQYINYQLARVVGEKLALKEEQNPNNT
ncbi:antitoxin HicB [Thermodesulfitimonas autotrophica]|uniref:Antitoxin HicB n=1 Tax=Thermodesulfitimonas autotrophica TaxID=1894989 RepID=A0A3N5ACT8_9THEO|nr:type II toxin-antitoxin system HicB family antitoxin [Thermodesulfitimonas autotrophica]RPF42696.1 antitoxin HicB [Thermodesulfitimonas autotrophica]